MLSTYFDQFNVVSLMTSPPLCGDWRMVFSNTSMMVVLTVMLTLLLFKGEKLMPNSWQVMMELIHTTIRSLVHENLGKTGQSYFPFVLCIFLFIVMLNVMGLFPYVFTPTAHMVVTFGLSLSIMMAVTMLGMLTFKVEFFSMLVPGGVPLIFAPFLVMMETLSYMISAMSLGVSLAANMSAGHLLFAILSGFAFNLLLNGFYLLGLIPVFIMGFMTLLELMVAVIQAYVFSLLTMIYLGDTMVLH